MRIIISISGLESGQYQSTSIPKEQNEQQSDQRSDFALRDPKGLPIIPTIYCVQAAGMIGEVG
jgi:hypothetical protein